MMKQLRIGLMLFQMRSLVLLSKCTEMGADRMEIIDSEGQQDAPLD